MKSLIKIIELTAVVLLIILTLVVLSQVVLRNLLNTGFIWGEELSRFLLISLVLIASPVVFYREQHVKFDLLARSVSQRTARIHRILCTLAIMFFYAVYIASHLGLMKNSGDVASPALKLPNRIYFSSALIGAVLAEILGVMRIRRILKRDKA